MSLNTAGALSAIAKIARILNQRRRPEASLEKALVVIGTTLNAQGAALCGRLGQPDQKGGLLDRLGFWQAGHGIIRTEPDGFPIALPTEKETTAPQEPYPSSPSIQFLTDPHCLRGTGVENLCLAPISGLERVYGWLMLWDLPDEETFRRAGDFLNAAVEILTLYVERLNFEKRLNDVIEFMPEPTFVVDHGGRIRHWNSAEEQLTGWKSERVLGKGNFTHALPFYNQRRPTVADLILKPDDEWEGHYRKFQRRGDAAFATAFCPSLPGGGALVTSKTHRLFDVDGRIWGAIHAVRDITRERQMEKKLQRSESMYRTITDYSGVGITLFRPDRVIYCNKRFGTILGIAHRSIEFDDILGWVVEEDRKGISQGFQALFEGRRKPIRMEIRAGREDGLRHYSTYAQMVPYGDKPTIHFVVDDVTERKELERNARRHELRLYHEDRLASLGTMAAGIAHELNQPLNTIRIVTDGLLYGRDLNWELDPRELYPKLEMVSKQVLRMSGVIQNVRSFAREDRRCATCDVDVNTAVENVLSMMGSQCQAHGIEIHKTLRDNLPPVQASLNRLEQVIMNLVVNGRQALDQTDHKRKNLWIKTGAVDEIITIEVADNAMGIPPELSAKIFDPFFTTKEAGEGTGLGLSISQSIVADFKGRIEADNNQWGGATFVVSLPQTK